MTVALSQVIARLHCADAAPDAGDPILDFGAYVAQSAVPGYADLVKVLEWEEGLKGLRGQNFPTPSHHQVLRSVLGYDVYNDLYIPVALQQDGIYRVYIPALGGPRSPESVATDFAFLLLAATVVPVNDSPEVILEVWWPDGRRVLADVDVKHWKALKLVLDFVLAGKHGRRPSTVCGRCSLRGTCETWDRLGAVLDLKKPAGDTPKTEAHRLWLEWVLLRELDHKTEARRKAVAQRLVQLAVNGFVDVNGLLKLSVQAQERQTWDFGPVYAVLSAAGLWRDEFASIRVGELKKALAKMPPAVRAQVERLAKTETTEPSFREAASGSERNIGDGLQTSPFVGVRL
jgi:hypothetical protein